jgi:hypothetical protein
VVAVGQLEDDTFLEATLELEAEVEIAAPAPAPVPRPVPATGSAFDALAMPPESAPRIPTFSAPAPAPAPALAPRNEVFASSWENDVPTQASDASIFGSAWDNGVPEPVLSGSASDPVPLATAADFLQPVAVSEDVSLEADMGEFVVESASAAALATNVREGGPSSIDEGKLELASNHDFIDNSQLTGTGAAWSDTRNSIPLEGEEEGEVIQGMVLEEEEPAPASAPEPADSWGVAISQPSPAPQAIAAPPPVRAPPPAVVMPPAARVVPPLTDGRPLQQPRPVQVVAPITSVTQSAVPVAGPGASSPSLTAVGSASGLQPVSVAGEHRVILHTVEGQVKRGAIKDAKLGEPQLNLQLANGGSESLPRERVKALFFMLAPGARAPSTEGDKVRVTFKDGRQVAGFSKDHRGPTSGFFVVPADNRTNTERIFIFRHAVQSISVDK